MAPRIEIFDRVEACEDLWRRFQDDAVATPFQRFDWVAAYLRSHPDKGRETRIILARDGGGEPLMLLPAAIERRLGLRIAAPIGGRQASYKMPIFARRPFFARGDFGTVLVEAGTAIGIDAYQFLNAPLTWDGLPNPLAAFSRPSPSDAFSLDLEPTGEATLARALDRAARKKLRQKEKWLARLGPVARIEPTGSEAIDSVLDAFFRQKSERLRSMGISDPFASGAARAFLRDGCRPPAPGLAAPIELHALTLCGRPVAVFAGAVDGERMSGMVTSFDSAEDVARCSPGDLLIARVIEAQCERGRKAFDLGVGEARYKRSFCDSVQPLVDVLVPVTESGRLYASAARLTMNAKRFVKQTSWTMRLVNTMRRGTALLT